VFAYTAIHTKRYAGLDLRFGAMHHP